MTLEYLNGAPRPRLPAPPRYWTPAAITHARRGESAPDAKPWTALVAETHAAIDRRRRANADALEGRNATWAALRTDIQHMYASVIAALRTQARHTKLAADEREDELQIMYPEKDFRDDGPRAEWEKTWVKTGWADESGKLNLPPRVSMPTGSRALLSVSPWAWRIPPALDVFLCWRADDSPVGTAIGRSAKRQPNASPADTVVYTDGAYDQAREGGAQKAGFGLVVVCGGDGADDAATQRRSCEVGGKFKPIAPRLLSWAQPSTRTIQRNSRP